MKTVQKQLHQMIQIKSNTCSCDKSLEELLDFYIATSKDMLEEKTEEPITPYYVRIVDTVLSIGEEVWVVSER